MTHLNYLQGLSPSGKTKRVTVASYLDATKLGIIQWSGRWRQYVFVPVIDIETQWSYDCLLEMSAFIQELNKKQRKKKEQMT